MQNAILFEKALKDQYLPAWRNQLGVEPSPLLSKIKKEKVTGKKIMATAPIGLSGGFGFGQEGTATPKAGGVQYEGFTEDIKDMYVNINISDKVMKMSANSASAMANALDVEVKGSYETAKWNVGRALFGNGKGILTTISALTTAGNTVTVSDTKLLKEGLIVDFYATGAAAGSTPAVAGRRIVAVDRAGKTITFDGAAATLAAGFITIQNSYCREITGLGAIYDDTITELYGLKKTEHPFLMPTVIDAGTDIDDSIITKALRTAQRDKNSKIDMLLCGDAAFDKYMEYLRVNNIRNEKTDLTLAGGFKAIGFTFGNRVVEVVNEGFVPDKEIWGVDTKSLQLHTIDDWNFVQKDGGIFTLMNDTSIFRALLANYGNMICTNPGGCVRIHNCCA